MKQLKLNLDKGNWGGRRSNSGRKRIHSPGVAHRKRENISSRTPAHINFKYSTSIRNQAFLPILKRGILNCRKKGLRIIHYSVQSNHIHFIVEADNNEILTSGMRSLTITLSKGINKGEVQLDYYHLHVLKSKMEAWNAVRYVVFNDQKHTGRRSIDKFSSVSNLLKLKFNYCVTPMDLPRSWLLSSR